VCHLARAALTAQVEVVGLDVVDGLGRRRFLLSGRERDPHRFGDPAHDSSWTSKTSAISRSKALRPDERVRLRDDELRGNPQPVAGPPEPGCQHNVRLELLPDLGRSHGLFR